MLTSILSRTQFLRIRETFYREVLSSPVNCTLTVTRVTKTDSLETFYGNSSREESSFSIHCLYKRQIPAGERTKYGISQDTKGIVYISPIELRELTGSETLDKQKTTVTLFGIEYAIEQLIYLEPIYDTYISAMIELKSLNKGA